MMDHFYQKTFDQIQMPEDRAQALRTRLAAQCSPEKQEVISMNRTKSFRRPAVALVAALTVCALSITAFAYGGPIVEAVHNFMTGGTIEQGVNQDGENYTAGSMDTTSMVSPVEQRDGHLYLTANGQDLDITDLCSYTTPYLYECIGQDGLRHAFVIGGDADAIGWAEFIWDKDGMPMGGNSAFGTNGGSDDAPWLNEGMKQLNLPWAS